MAKYEIKFRGRTKGAIGIFYDIHAIREADTPANAVLALYDEFEHVQQPYVRLAGSGIFERVNRSPGPSPADERREEWAQEDRAERRKGEE